jgi:hypothetical protein
MYSFYDMSPLNGKTRFSAILFVMAIKHVVRCHQDTQCIAGLSCDRVIIEYTYGEYCDMLLTFSDCNS